MIVITRFKDKLTMKIVKSNNSNEAQEYLIEKLDGLYNKIDK